MGEEKLENKSNLFKYSYWIVGFVSCVLRLVLSNIDEAHLWSIPGGFDGDKILLTYKVSLYRVRHLLWT